MASIAIYDANVLYPSTLRDLLIRIAQAGLVQAKWSDKILDEAFANLTANRPDLDPGRLARTRELMIAAVRDCMVSDYEALIETIKLPDPDDRHVVAAAITAHGQVIVTANTRDFPAGELSRWSLEVKTPDEFVMDQIDVDPEAVLGAAQRIADSWRNPLGGLSDVIRSLERGGLAESAAALTLRIG